MRSKSSDSDHPFRTTRQFERAIAPYMKLPTRRHLHFDFWECINGGGSFRSRLLRRGVDWATMHEHETAHRGLADFLRAWLPAMAQYFTEPEDAYSDEDREIARLYCIPLPGAKSQEHTLVA